MTTSVKANTDILEYAVETYRGAFEKLRDVENLLFSLSFEPIPVSMIKQSNIRGENALGLKPDEPLVVVLFYTSWDYASDDERIYDVNKEALRKIEQEAESRNLSAAYLYLNYSFTHQDPFSSYGSESKAKLQAVSKKYDPEGLFQSVIAGPFKL